MEAGEYTSPTAASNGSGQSPWDAHEAAQTSARPEIPVIAAFVGGFILAKLLGKLGGDDD